MPTIRLPTAVGHLAAYRMGEPRAFPAKAAGPFNRVALAAAHVVADPLADVDPWLDVAIDWERTIAYREHLWDLGLGVAEAMDTAQRGMGLEWNAARELIRRSLDAARGRRGALIFCGAGTDQLPPSPRADDRRRDPRLRGADRGDRAHGRPHRADGEPRARRLRQDAGRLRRPCTPHPRAAARAVHHPLAGRDVRPGAGRLLRPPRPHGRDGRVRRHHRGQRRQDRRHQAVAARQGQGARAARPPARGRAHVYRRRLQLSRADRGRRRAHSRRAARHLRPDRAGGVRRAVGAGGGAHGGVPRDPGADRAARRATSSRRRPASTRPAWCSWPT